MTTATAPYPRADIAAAVAQALRRANDYSDPLLDGDRNPLKYAGMSQDFRSGAWRHLDEGDLPQASNQVWGLVAETIKAVSAEHGGFIHTHRSITEVAQDLAQLPRNAGDAASARQISRAVFTANQLHANFYENQLSEYTILEGLIQCEEMSELMFALFWPAGAPPTPAPVAAAHR